MFANTAITALKTLKLAKPTKPKVLSTTQNTITISWQNLFTNTSTAFIYTLQQCNILGEWCTVYKGGNTEYKLKNLAPSTCYNLRIKPENKQDWMYFKCATDHQGPYLVTHMTRAVMFGKTAVIRKIAHINSHLLETENNVCKTPLMQAIEKGDLSLVTLLVNLGANIDNPLLFTNRTALMVAIFTGNLQIASYLIDKGCNVKARDTNNLSVLHYAIDSNNLENVKFVVKRQLIDVNCQDNKGWIPLLRAVILECKQEIVDYLLENGANPLIADRKGADFYQHQKILKCSLQSTSLTFLPQKTYLKNNLQESLDSLSKKKHIL